MASSLQCKQAFSAVGPTPIFRFAANPTQSRYHNALFQQKTFRQCSESPCTKALKRNVNKHAEVLMDASGQVASKGYHWYETMLVLSSKLGDDISNKELAKFEALLQTEGCTNIHHLPEVTSQMAYPMKKEWNGVYVLYTYRARRESVKRIQDVLSKPEAGSEAHLLRHITQLTTEDGVWRTGNRTVANGAP